MRPKKIKFSVPGMYVNHGAYYLRWRPDGTRVTKWLGRLGKITKEDAETTLGENVSGVPVDAFVLFPKKDGLTVPWDEELRLLEVKSIFAVVEEVKADQIQ